MPDLVVRPQLQLGSLSDPAELGRMLSASGYFADVQDAAQAVVKVLAGAELGIPPIAAMTGVYIVKGRVTLSANLIAALIKRHPRYDLRLVDLTNDRCVIEFLQDGDVLGVSTFTIEDARAAGLASGENWKHYPRNMLYARAVSNGAKWFVPDVFAGAPVYTPDELGAEIDPETGDMDTYTIEVGGHTVDRQTGEVREPEPQPEPERQPETPPAAADPPPGPRPAAAAPVAAGADQGSENGADDPIDNAEFAKLLELLDELKAPESFRRMTVMAYGIEDLAQLTRGQALIVADKARARFGS